MEIRPLDRQLDRNSFDCGVSPLNEYLQRYALQNQKKDAARTYVGIEGESIVGYYTLVFGSVSTDDATPDVAAGLGRYPIPIILIARLAVDVSMKGKGLGGQLLRDALLRSLQASNIAGLRAVLVHAKDDGAKQFYQKYGFVASPLDELQLFLRISDIRESIS